jgi:translation initiation factor 4A
MCALDETDEMLSRGFKDQIYDIFCLLPSSTHVVLSATMSAEVLEVTKKVMREPVRILVKEELTLEGIRQFYIQVDKEEWKLDTLCDLYETLTITQVRFPTVICMNSISCWCINAGYHFLQHPPQGRVADRADAEEGLHGLVDARRHGPGWPRRDYARVPLGLLPCAHRHRPTCPRYRRAAGLARHQLRPAKQPRELHFTGALNCLPPAVVPTLCSVTCCRIGRGGRFGRKGVAINFVTADEILAMREIEQFYNTQIEKMPMNVADLL